MSDKEDSMRTAIAGCHGCAVQQPCRRSTPSTAATAQPWRPAAQTQRSRISPVIAIALLFFLTGCANSAKNKQDAEFVRLVDDFLHQARQLCNAESDYGIRARRESLGVLSDTLTDKVRVWSIGSERDHDREMVLLVRFGTLAAIDNYILRREMLPMASRTMSVDSKEYKAVVDNALDARDKAKAAVGELEEKLEKYKSKY
jgi:hypothetical protein